MNSVPRNGPENSAIAVNYKCTRCKTVARAIQYVRQVDDPRETPDDVRDMVDRLDRELRRLNAEQRRLTADEAEARINSVIERFSTMAQGQLGDRRDEDDRENHQDRDDRDHQSRCVIRGDGWIVGLARRGESVRQIS